jgi:AMMECR1 domain-containing protein
MIRKGGRRGLLLPQVAAEQGWDRQAFLSNTCRKAGLPADEWEKGAELYSFTAEVFGE